jgi:hypothetical protein
MGSRQSVVRVQGGIGPSRPTIASFCVVLTVWAFLLGAITLAISSVAINHPAFEPRLDFYTNSTETSECQDEVLLGHYSCIDDAYKVNRFDWPTWFVLFGILPLGLLAVASLVPVLVWNAERFFWWIMFVCVVTFFVMCCIVCVMLSIWWAHCKNHSFCVMPRYNFDFTGEVSFRGADVWFILHCCGHFLMLVASAGILVTTLWLQYLAGFAAMAMQMSGFSRSPDTDNRLIGDDMTAGGDQDDGYYQDGGDDDGDADEYASNEPVAASANSSSSSKHVNIPLPPAVTGVRSGEIRQRAPQAPAPALTIAQQFNLPQAKKPAATTQPQHV